MKRIWGAVLAISVAGSGLPAAPAWAGPQMGYAKSSCQDRVRRDYNAGTRSVTISDRGHDRYTVTGEATRSGRSAHFTCGYDHGAVQSVSVDDWYRGGSSGSSGNSGGTVAAVGAAVALAAIIAAASSKNRSHENDRYEQRGYGSGDNDIYSPVNGITCYRAQRACFDNYNNYDPRWTQREFNY